MLPEITEYLRYLRSAERPKTTRDAYLLDLKQFAQGRTFLDEDNEEVDYEDLTDIRQITVRRVLDWHEWLRTRALDGGPLSHSSMRRKHSAIRGFCTWALEEHYLDNDPCRRLPKIKRSRSRIPREIPVNVIVAMFKRMPLATPVDIRNRAILEVAYASGPRLSELSRLDLQDVYRNPRGSTLRIIGKGEEPRKVPITPRGIYWINKYQQYARPHLLRGKAETALFLTTSGRRMARRTIGEVFPEAAEGIEGMPEDASMHSLRHSFATALSQGNVPTQKIQKILGHADPKTTEIYIDVAVVELIEAVYTYHPLAYMPIPG